MASEPVLIVDDNEQNLRLAVRVLASEGYDVRTAADAEEAFEVLKGFTPKVILMDVQLPRMDGLELTRRLKADPAHRGVAIIAVTAYAMMGDRERALAAGCDGYLAKPFDILELSRVVARFARPHDADGAW
jgi:two-component system cell cycle response regulator DivK